MRYATLTIEQYLSDAASDKPAPGGGSVSALAAALGAAMGEMSANFTVGKKKFAAVQQEVSECLGRLTECRARLLALMDADVEAYTAVGAAYSMPKDDEAQKAARDRAIKGALSAAMRVPLDIMRQCAVVSEASARLARIANPNLITDVAVCSIFAEAACAAARLNVEVNLKYIRDEKLTESLRPELDRLSEVTLNCREDVGNVVREHLA